MRTFTLFIRINASPRSAHQAHASYNIYECLPHAFSWFAQILEFTRTLHTNIGVLPSLCALSPLYTHSICAFKPLDAHQKLRLALAIFLGIFQANPRLATLSASSAHILLQAHTFCYIAKHVPHGLAKHLQNREFTRVTHAHTCTHSLINALNACALFIFFVCCYLRLLAIFCAHIAIILDLFCHTPEDTPHPFQFLPVAAQLLALHVSFILRSILMFRCFSVYICFSANNPFRPA